MPVGCFAAGDGAAAALIAAAERPDRVAAVVWHGGRPEVARDAVARVTAPMLLILGSHDVDHVAAVARDWFVRHLVR
jgi:dienelactone hydrolase